MHNRKLTSRRRRHSGCWVSPYPNTTWSIYIRRNIFYFIKQPKMFLAAHAHTALPRFFRYRWVPSHNIITSQQSLGNSSQCAGIRMTSLYNFVLFARFHSLILRVVGPVSVSIQLRPFIPLRSGYTISWPHHAPTHFNRINRTRGRWNERRV